VNIFSLSLSLSLSLYLSLSAYLTKNKLKLSRDDKTRWMRGPQMEVIDYFYGITVLNSRT
jgi:hypothetical protein